MLNLSGLLPKDKSPFDEMIRKTGIVSKQGAEMDTLYVTHYYVQGTDPWKNIMLLPEETAFQKAAELASAHKGMTSYGRFEDFQNYYPLRKAADKLVREQFICLGGKPQLEHPYSFVLGESDYLKAWFNDGDSLRIPLDEIPDELISFTLGDSCAKLSKNDSLEALTKQMLIERLHIFDDSLESLIQSIAPYGYVEAQLWYGPAG